MGKRRASWRSGPQPPRHMPTPAPHNKAALAEGTILRAPGAEPGLTLMAVGKTWGPWRDLAPHV